MSGHKNKGVAKGSSGIVVGDGRHKSSLRLRVTGLLVVALLILILLSSVGYGIVHHIHQAQQKTLKSAQEEKKKQQALANPITYSGNPKALSSYATSVINDNGASSIQKAQAYEARGEAESNLGLYSQAFVDYKKAVQLNPQLAEKLASQEFYTGYKAGEHQSLIPYLQTMIAVQQKQKSDFSGSNIANYQQYIQDIQAGKNIDL